MKIRWLGAWGCASSTRSVTMRSRLPRAVVRANWESTYWISRTLTDLVPTRNWSVRGARASVTRFSRRLSSASRRPQRTCRSKVLSACWRPCCWLAIGFVPHNPYPDGRMKALTRLEAARVVSQSFKRDGGARAENPCSSRGGSGGSLRRIGHPLGAALVYRYRHLGRVDRRRTDLGVAALATGGGSAA